jgi:hypothetical protein
MTIVKSAPSGSYFATRRPRAARGHARPQAAMDRQPRDAKLAMGDRGIRRSGYGRELLGLGLKEFVNYKLIDVVDIDAHF